MVKRAFPFYWGDLKARSGKKYRILWASKTGVWELFEIENLEVAEKLGELIALAGCKKEPVLTGKARSFRQAWMNDDVQDFLAKH